MLADTCGEFTKAVDMELDATALLGNVRSKRYTGTSNDLQLALLNKLKK